MERYLEQSVAFKASARNTMLYVLCWILIVVLALAAMLFGANATDGASIESGINWLSMLGFVVCLAAAVILLRRKDYLRMEFDYIINSGALEITAVLNRRRRKKLAHIDLQRVQQAGCGNAKAMQMGNAKVHKWYANAACNYIVYMEESTRHIALLEMNDELAALVRGSLPVGAWRNEEGKSSNYASLS